MVSQDRRLTACSPAEPKGQAALEKLYSKVFAVNKGAKLTITVTSARMIGADTALEDGITEVAPADGGPPTVGAFSAVLVQKDVQWYFREADPRNGGPAAIER